MIRFGVRYSPQRRGKNRFFNMYSFDSRVRYSEIDENGFLTLTGMMNYMQDCSTFQSESIGRGLAFLREQGKAWWVNAWEIEVRRLPALGEHIRVSTWPHGFKGIFGVRNFLIEAVREEEDEGGKGIREIKEPLVLADSLWFYFDLAKKKPAKVPQDEAESYGPEGEPLPLPPISRKIPVPEGGEELQPIRVERHHLDTNRHMNNAQYVAIARELLPEEFSTGSIRVEYRNMAVLGDQMYPYIVETGEGFLVSLRDRKSGVFASLVFSGKEDKHD